VAQSSTHFHAVEGYPSLSLCFLPSHTCTNKQNASPKKKKKHTQAIVGWLQQQGFLLSILLRLLAVMHKAITKIWIF
jgi:uncharacterized membrane protein YdjX (TVP38/TMEM64 family)